MIGITDMKIGIGTITVEAIVGLAKKMEEITTVNGNGEMLGIQTVTTWDIMISTKPKMASG
jgi:hypothetical protein